MKLAGLAVAALLLAAGAALACSGDGDGGGEDDGPVELLIINQNILHGLIDEDPAAEPNDRFSERIELLADALVAAQPDVVMLQEVRSDGDPSTGYPVARDVLLEALGSEYEAVFGNFLGEPIDASGLGQLTITRLPIASTGNHSVSAIRSAVHVAVQTELGVVDLYNVHLEGTGAVLDVEGDASVVEVNNVVEFIRQTRSGTGPVIVAGDFNAEPVDPSIAAFMGPGGFIDALDEGGDATCEGQGDPGCSSDTIPLGDNPQNLTDHRIDYIFVLPGDDIDIEVVSADRFQDEPIDIGGGRLLWLSDHIGMQATVRLQEK
jgi:endonuclease/exonuclease/phosphatase family metal-dependent hydrolase